MAKIDIWLIVGTRRWARIMAAELCTILPEGAAIHLQGDQNDPELRQWLKTSALENRIKVVATPLPCRTPMTGVALIVNSAYLHHVSIENALSAGYNVVSEKPMSFSREGTLALLNRGKILGLMIFSTNTYLFADYLNTFRKNWLEGRKFTAMDISWSDATKEVRYGETKGYDSGVPLIFDVLPHIANIILATLGECEPVAIEIRVRRGGSEVSIQYRQGGTDIHVQIARNARKRTRCVKFSGPGSEVMVDFSNEPGKVVIDRGAPLSVDPDWHGKRKPIATMLDSVIEYFESGKLDARLSPLAGLYGNELIDGVVDSYVEQQVDLLATLGEKQSLVVTDADYSYADKESRSIAERVLPFIAENSPLRKLAMATRKCT